MIPADMLADFYIAPTDKGTYKIDMVANDTAVEVANGDTPAAAALNVWFEIERRKEKK